MLTAHQAETVAFVTDGGIICRDCAEKRFGEMGTAAIEEGFAEFVPSDVSPICRYELDSWAGEIAWENASEIVRNDDDGDVTDAERDSKTEDERIEAVFASLPVEYFCDDCGGDVL